jgi:hypothetical protein
VNVSRLAAARSVVITSLALGIGPVAVLLTAGARGRWMWDLSSAGLPIWQPGNWLLDPWIVGSFLCGAALIAVVELRGGTRAAQFRLAVRLSPVAFAGAAAVVLVADPVLPTWMAWPLTTWGTAADPRSLHEVVLALGTPLAFVGVLLPAWWLGTGSRSQAQVGTPVRVIWLAVRVYLVGYLGASIAATVPLIGTLLGLLVCAMPLGLVLAPGLLVSTWWWARSLGSTAPADASSARWRWLEPALLFACGVMAFMAFRAMSGTGAA